jgi:uncharacterized membrane protein
VSLYETLVFLHVASAFAFIASYVAFSAAFVAGLRVDRADAARAVFRMVGPASALAWIGATGTLVFGVWLTLQVTAYDLFDGWIAAALALWLVTEEAIRREDLLLRKARRAARAAFDTSGRPSAEIRDALRSRQAALLHLTGGAGMLALLAVMIFKPGAS